MGRGLSAIKALAQARPGVFGPACSPASARAGLPDGGLTARVAAWIGDQWRADVEARRLFLWLPVFFGAGALAYFAAEQEPSAWPALAAMVGFAALAWRASQMERAATARASLALAVLFAGFAAGAVRTASVQAPVIERTMVARVTGFVETVDLRPGGARLMLAVAAVEGLSPERTPERVRVNMRGRPAFLPGDTIAAAMRLSPPPAASVPGGYDFAREAYFRGLGGVGSVSSRPEIVAPMAVGWRLRLLAAVDRARNALTDRIAAVIGGPQGAVAAALVTGKRGLIPEETNEALRAAGIYHVVSISGLHMMLAAGLFLWSLRALLALFPAVALRRPIKKWAAAFAICGAVAYNVFSGSEVATERAMIMVIVMLGATLVDRPAVSMRNLAVAALLVLAHDPSSVLGPSFQMSFAAVAAMTALYERRPGAVEPADRREAPPGVVDRARMFVGAMIATTLVASLATDPFGAFHFNRIALYGLIGNALSLPLVEFVVMPAALVGVVANLFGLDAPVWTVMGWGVAFMLDVARWVAALPGSVRMVHGFGGGALLLMTLGLIWITLWQSTLRWLGVAFALLGLVLALRAPQPDLVIDARGQALAYRGLDGRLHALAPRGDAFAIAQWLAGDADPRTPERRGAPLEGRCDALGCVGRLRDERRLALVIDRRALAEDCARAHVIVTRLAVGDVCSGPALALDAAFFAAHGATRAFLSADGAWRLETARTAAQDRPWSPAPRRAPEPAFAPVDDDEDAGVGDFVE